MLLCNPPLSPPSSFFPTTLSLSTRKSAPSLPRQIVVFVGLVAACIVAATSLGQDFQVEDLAPSNSFVAEFINADTRFFEQQIG